jgi:4-cresol dehydrogenase (hydroxylating) flavoprotein subunit
MADNAHMPADAEHAVPPPRSARAPVSAEPPRLRDALAAWAEAVGVDHVQFDDNTVERYARTTGPKPTRPLAVLTPASTQQVQRVVQIAGRFGLSVYPISRGRNWGYGDACAPTDGQVIVDLRRMGRIVEVNAELAYAVIEPGVTQGQLYEHLREHHAGLCMDATGAGPDASVVGNALERGFGHTRYGDHVRHTCGLEVVLPDGRVLNTGFGHYGDARAARVYAYGVGPMLDGLFSQSNLGIVTRMGVWLMPEPEAFCAFFFRAGRDADLSDIIDRLRPLRLQGLIQTAVHVANDLRVLSSRGPYPWDRTEVGKPLSDDVRVGLRREHRVGVWNGCGAITGTRATVAATRKAVRRALRPYGVLFLDDRRMAQAKRAQRALRATGVGRWLGETIDLAEPVYDVLRGRPSREHLRGAAWRVRGLDTSQPHDPLNVHAGLMWTSPVVPATGHDARRVMDIVEPIYAEHGFDALVTFTMINERAMCCVTNMAFDIREAAEASRASACHEALSTALREAGYHPYRVAAGAADALAEGSAVFWDVVKDLKTTLDPGGVIAPGRYEPRGE